MLSQHTDTLSDERYESCGRADYFGEKFVWVHTYRGAANVKHRGPFFRRVGAAECHNACYRRDNSGHSARVRDVPEAAQADAQRNARHRV